MKGDPREQIRYTSHARRRRHWTTTTATGHTMASHPRGQRTGAAADANDTPGRGAPKVCCSSCEEESNALYQPSSPLPSRRRRLIAGHAIKRSMSLALVCAQHEHLISAHICVLWHGVHTPIEQISDAARKIRPSKRCTFISGQPL